MTIENPTNFKELYDAFNLADRTELKNYADYAEKTTEDRIALLEHRLLIVGVCFNTALNLLMEKDGKSTNQ